MPEMLDQKRTRHMAHSCVTFWFKTTPKRRQCDTILAESDTEIVAMAEKQVSAVA
jgi:hypothetical protein